MLNLKTDTELGWDDTYYDYECGDIEGNETKWNDNTTKEDIANDINAIVSEISREVWLSETPEEGTIWNNHGKAESWTDGGQYSFAEDCTIPDAEPYILWIEGEIEVHKVDYLDEKECNILSAGHNEKEVLIPATTKLEVLSVSELDEETGFGTIIMKVVK